MGIHRYFSFYVFMVSSCFLMFECVILSRFLSPRLPPNFSRRTQINVTNMFHTHLCSVHRFMSCWIVCRFFSLLFLYPAFSLPPHSLSLENLLQHMNLVMLIVIIVWYSNHIIFILLTLLLFLECSYFFVCEKCEKNKKKKRKEGRREGEANHSMMK